MAGIVTFSNRTTVATIREQFHYTQCRLNQHKLTRGKLATEFAGFGTRIVHAEGEDNRLLLREMEIAAAIGFLDDGLDSVVDLVSGAVGTDRKDPQYRQLFGSKRPSEFKRPIMGDQLDAMRNWPAMLEDATHPLLVLARTELQTLLPEADAAVAEQSAVQAALRKFRETGIRSQLIADFNALRKSIYGKLAALQHDPANRLRPGWAESFFRSSSSSLPPTLREIEQRMVAVQQQYEMLGRRRDELAALEEQAAFARAEAERKARATELELKRRAMAELAAQVAALESTLQQPDAEPSGEIHADEEY